MRILVALLGLWLAVGKAKQPIDGASAFEKTGTTPLPALPGFRVVQGPTTYGPDNLFEYIDGGADAFLLFEFEELQTTTFLGPQQVEVTVDLYRHKDADRAYGIYALERPPGATPIAVGVEGYAGGDYLQFAIGSFYVKLVQSGPKADFVLRRFAEKIADKLGGRKSAPAVLGAFPEKGKVLRSEKMAPSNFLGHSFFHDGISVHYQIDGASFHLFVVRGTDSSDARKMVERYRAVAKAPAAEVKPAGSETLKDPYHGEVLLRWSGRWLWGAIEQASPLRPQLLDELGQRLIQGQ